MNGAHRPPIAVPICSRIFIRGTAASRAPLAGNLQRFRGMTKRAHRPQKAEETLGDDARPMVVRPLENLDDRRHNPKDIEVDAAAIAAGIEHGGTIESRAEALALRGSGGRKRSGAFGRYRSGRDISKKR
jgi:hypothetical protein